MEGGWTNHVSQMEKRLKLSKCLTGGHTGSGRTGIESRTQVWGTLGLPIAPTCSLVASLPFGSQVGPRAQNTAHSAPSPSPSLGSLWITANLLFQDGLGWTQA